MKESTHPILIVEDEHRLCDLIRRGLEQISDIYDIHEAHSGAEAIELLKQKDFDVMITDIRMPGMSGIELLERVRDIQDDLQTIVITGHGDLDNAIEALRLGAANYIKKPVTFQVLHYSLEKCIERRRLTIRLRDSEERFRRSFHDAASGMVTLSPEGIIWQVNTSFCAILNCAQSDLEGKPLLRWVSDADQEYYQQTLDNFISGKCINHHFDLRLFRQDKTVVWANISVSAVTDEQEKLGYFIVQVVDITERKTAENALERLAKELTQLINTANAPIFGINQDLQINEWNQMASLVTGYAREEVFGKRLVDDFIAEDYRGSVRRILDDALAGRDTVNFELPLYRKDGKRSVIIFNASSRRDAEGKIVGVIGVGQDITELNEYRKYLEQRVEERTQELHTALKDAENTRDYINGILKSMANGLIVTDNDYHVILMNRAAEELLQVQFSDIYNRPIDFAFPDKSLGKAVKKTLLQPESDAQFDFELKHTEAVHPLILRASTSTIRDKQGQITGIITIFHDVSHEREVDRMKSEFISTAAHELRTPITSIQGFSEILLTRPNLGEDEQKRFLNHIFKQAKILAAIINDLLDLSRIESGKSFALNKESCFPGEVIEEVIEPFITHNPQHIFNLDLLEPPVEIDADIDKLAQVLKNLISNAVKYSPEGGPVKIQESVTTEAIQFRVSDAGIGMTPEEVRKIFQKFYRADTSNKAIDGTGLGMSITKHIIEAHDGKIWVESTRHQGTTVIFSLPLKNPGSTPKHYHSRAQQ